MSSNSKNAVSTTDKDAVEGDGDLHYVPYGAEKESPYLPAIRQLISRDLSEPYSIYVYRYFLYQWGDLCFMVRRHRTFTSCVPLLTVPKKALDDHNNLIGVIVCKLEPHRGGPMRGYIAMLATRSEHRGRGIATQLVKRAVDKMIEKDADEVCLSPSIRPHPVETDVDRTDCIRNRSRQLPFPPYLREPGLSTHQASTSLLS